MVDEVLTEKRDRVLVITLNRPEARNAINTALAEGLNAAIALLDGDDSLSIGVMTGAGPGFCAGIDLKAFAAGGTPKGFDVYLRKGARKPLIAAVEGFCLAGGLEVALVCDLIVAAEDVRFGIPEAGVGLFAAGGALLRLPGHVPFGVAMEMALTADPITAARALELGLVARLAEKGKALESAIALAERIARNAPLALAASKQVLRMVKGRTEEDLWAQQAPIMRDVFVSEDAREGPRAFAEKRAPRWAGK